MVFSGWCSGDGALVVVSGGEVFGGVLVVVSLLCSGCGVSLFIIHYVIVPLLPPVCFSLLWILLDHCCTWGYAVLLFFILVNG